MRNLMGEWEMNTTLWASRAAGLCALLFAFTLTARADEEPKKKDAPKAEEKRIVIMLDASKLPPDVLKKLLELGTAEPKKGSPTPEAKKAPPGLAKKQGQKKPGAPEKKPTAPEKKAGKVISLAEAIAIAEKIGGGQATKAERKGEGEELHFKIEVEGKGGSKQKIELNANGSRRQEEEPKKPEKKKDD